MEPATVTAPQGDRLAQARNAYYAGQQLLAFKQLRWWWSNQHHAVYDAADGAGVAPHGPQTEWVPQSKSIGFLEYGFPTSDARPMSRTFSSTLPQPPAAFPSGRCGTRRNPRR